MRYVGFITLPVIIDGPGEYKTRDGRVAVIESVTRHVAKGFYKDCKTRETWDISGRTLPFTENRNDIVGENDGQSNDLPVLALQAVTIQ